MTNPRDKSKPDNRETILYLATCLDTAKQYVGITKQSLRTRMFSHFTNAKNNRGVFPSALRKYGKDSFVFKHVASGLSWEDGCILEQQLIIQYGSLAPNGYNTILNSNSRPRAYNREEHNKKISEAMKRILTPEWHAKCLIASLDQEVRARARANMIGRKLSPEHIEKIRIAKTGIKQSLETIEKRVLKLRGKKRTPEMIEKIRSSNLGRKRSPEVRQRISEMQTGRLLKAETKQKLSVALKGRKKTPEHCKNISEARKGMKFSEEHLRNITIANRENSRKRREARLAEARATTGDPSHVRA